MSLGQASVWASPQAPSYSELLVWLGDFYADWELMLPTVADKRNLAHVYDMVCLLTCEQYVVCCMS